VRAQLEAGKSPLAVMPTGAGKTVVFSRLLAEHGGSAVVLAHRKELVSQISRSLAIEGVPHRIIAPRQTVRMIASANSEHVGRAYYEPGAPIGVAGVDSVKNIDPRWARACTLKVQDEAHHVLQGNKWGDALGLFQNAALVGFTASPERSDGKGLGAHADGLFDTMVFGPTMRELIEAGSLSRYRLIAAASAKMDLAKATVSRKTGDYTKRSVSAVMADAGITGDVVEHYQRFAPGTLNITFVTSVEAAEEMAQAYRDAGVPAAALSAKTPAGERCKLIKQFARRELLVLCNVDLFGEGFDLSAAAGVDVCVESVSMARPTASFGLYLQQFGRALRLGEGKEQAVILDHVGNTVRFGGPPDYPRLWSLDAKERKSSAGPTDAEQIRVCGNPMCLAPYERELGLTCPYCGHTTEPTSRRSPDAVAGDLVELDADVLKSLREAAERAVWPDSKLEAHWGRMASLPEVARRANVKRGRATRDAQATLRTAVVRLFASWEAEGLDERRMHRRFYLTYGIDVMAAFALNSTECAELEGRIGGR
jgi:superfamily II DNA or RNA helicase